MINFPHKDNSVSFNSSLDRVIVSSTSTFPNSLFDDLLGRLLIVPEGVGSHLRLVLGEALGGLRQVDEPSQLSELGRDDVQMGPGDFEHKGRE